MLPRDNPGIYHHAEHECQQCRRKLRALYQQLAVYLVGECAPEQRHGKQGHGDAQVNEAEDSAASGDLIGEVALREHLHLRARHQEEHAHPEQREIEIAERLESAPEACRKRLCPRRDGGTPGSNHLFGPACRVSERRSL